MFTGIIEGLSSSQSAFFQAFQKLQVSIIYAWLNSRELVAVGKIKVGPAATCQFPVSFLVDESIGAKIVSPKLVTRCKLPLHEILRARQTRARE
jgi:hypothetical protein